MKILECLMTVAGVLRKAGICPVCKLRWFPPQRAVDCLAGHNRVAVLGSKKCETCRQTKREDEFDFLVPRGKTSKTRKRSCRTCCGRGIHLAPGRPRGVEEKPEGIHLEHGARRMA